MPLAQCGVRQHAGASLPRQGWLCRRSMLLAALAGLAGLQRCASEPPIRIGLLAGLSGDDIPNAEDGRNGAILAVEQRNATGGVRGRQLALSVQDAGPDPAAAKVAAGRVLASKVEAVVGPYPSSAVLAVLPQLHAARVLALSPMASAGELTGVDDYLVRLQPSTQDVTRVYSRHLYQSGQRRVALAAADDARGGAYAGAWRRAFSASFRALGGLVVAEAGYDQGSEQAFGDVVQQLLASQPDGLVLVGGPLAVARLVQQARKQAPHLPIAVSEAAASAALIELGGRAADGVLTAQLYDAADTSPRYLQFKAAYQARFDRPAGFYALATHDAITVLADAMALQHADEPLKQAVLRNKACQGLQRPLVFDRFGDLSRALHFAVLRQGRFETLP